jgi:heat shock protein HtpX
VKRILIFGLMNIAVIAVIALLLRVLGLDTIHFGRDGEISYVQLLGASAVYGFVGSFVSLAMSKTVAKWSVGARVIAQPRDQTEAWLLNSVRDLSQRAGIGTCHL